MPFQKGADSVALIIVITTVSVVPVHILDIQSRRKTLQSINIPMLLVGLFGFYVSFC